MYFQKTIHSTPNEVNKTLLETKHKCIDVRKAVGSINIVEEKENEIVVKSRKKPLLIVPKYVVIDEDLAWLIGFYLAEGNKVSYGIGMSNCNEELITQAMNIMEQKFLINKGKWSGFLRTSVKDIEVIRNKQIKYVKKEKTKIYYTPLARQDSIEVRINSTVLSIILKNVFNAALDIILSERSLAIRFLEGFECGDGCILQRKGYIYGISITVKSEEYKNLLLKAFNLAYGINPYVRKTKGAYEVTCRGVKLMTEFILDGHFYSHKAQWKKLLDSYLMKEYVRSHIRYWRILNKAPMLSNDLAAAAGRSWWAVNDAMRTDEKIGIVSREKIKINNKKGPHNSFYSINNKGKMLLALLEVSNL
jgi:hypothetical protein